MTDEQIIKALEMCANRDISCEVCAYAHDIDCGLSLLLDILSLVKRQIAEIERLSVENERQKAEIERLTEQLKTARADAMKEFAAELSAEIRDAIYSSYKNYSPVDPESYHTFIGKSAALRGVYEAMVEILQKMTGDGEK